MKILALGDSYTIGEGVGYSENYPSQLIHKFNESGKPITELNIIAKTGWTTGELLEAIKEQNIVEKFDYVFLLIGVNNQYRAYDIEEYRREFQQLLTSAINYSNNVANVFVLSIPDWGNTPFAKDRDSKVIEEEIDQFNQVNFLISQNCHVNYINVTDSTRIKPLPESMLASDELHPSSKMYSLWVELIWEKLRVRF